MYLISDDRLDLVFIVDSSSNLSPQEFETTKSVVKGVVENFEVQWLQVLHFCVEYIRHVKHNNLNDRKNKNTHIET